MTSGIFANQTALNTVGHNITNANSEGYSRQTLHITAAPPDYSRGVAVGTGAESESLTRARDTYADVQYRNENCKQTYYETISKNYDKLEAIFNDATDSGIEAALKKFYTAWVDVSVSSSDAATRTAVAEKAKIFADSLTMAQAQLTDQITQMYDDITMHVQTIDELMESIVVVNKAIVAREANGAMANDLRDKRDLLVDELSGYVNISVKEDIHGAYYINSGGVGLVSGTNRLHLQLTQGVASEAYGPNYGTYDQMIKIRESKNSAYIPQSGILRAEFDAIADCKSYIDNIANMATFMLTTLNAQHAQGIDLEGNAGRNFYGETNKIYEYAYNETNDYSYVIVKDAQGNEVRKLTGIEIIGALRVNEDFYKTGGYKYVAAATSYDNTHDFNDYVSDSSTSKATLEEHQIEWGSRTGDGTNAVYLSELFNMNYDNITTAGQANVLAIKANTIVAKTANSYIDPGNRDKIYKADMANELVIYDNGGEFGRYSALGNESLNAYYKSFVTRLGVEASSVDTVIEEQGAIMTQIQDWRDSQSGVDWNEELTNMIKFQKAFSACARCLNAMDECYERLANSTGMVGR